MQIFNVIRFGFIFILSNFMYHCSSMCSKCTHSSSCYHCLNTFPQDRAHVEYLHLICTSNSDLFRRQQQRFYSIIQSYSTVNCTMTTFYLDQYTLWNYLETMSITYAHLTRFSPVIFNRTSSSSPILYSIKMLNLSHNSLRRINKNFAYYFPSLIRLDLSHNRLVQLKQKTFINLIHLKELYLNDNYLRRILSTVLPRQLLRVFDLSGNRWHCSCTNVITLISSRTPPLCQTPIEHRTHHADLIARQCFFRSKAFIHMTIDIDKGQTTHQKNVNLTCALTSSADRWQNETINNVRLISAWHIEEQRSIPIEQLDKSENYLICFDPNSTRSQSVRTVIALTSNISTRSSLRNKEIPMNTTVPMIPEVQLSPFLLWLFKSSKTILPYSFRTSNKHVLIVWLILLILAIVIFSFLLYFIYRHRHRRQKSTDDEDNRIPSCTCATTEHQPLFPEKTNSKDLGTAFNIKFRCKNHKCLCQYRHRVHSTTVLPPSAFDETAAAAASQSVILSRLNSADPSEHLSICVRPALIGPSELRYAKIKRISSSNESRTGEFRTIVRMKTLPN